jgi:hypothetical protein
MPTKCALKKALLFSYSDTTKTYYETVMELRVKLGEVPKPEYDKLLHLSEAARLTVEKARIEMERHIKTHGC